MSAPTEQFLTTHIVDPATGGFLAIRRIGAHAAASPLTLCCQASAKGSEGGTVCRACYTDIDPMFGGIYDLTQPSSMPDDLYAALVTAMLTAGIDWPPTANS